MKFSIYTLCVFSLLFPSIVWSGSTNVLLGKQFCSQDRSVCIKGSIDYNYSNGKLLLHARVGQTRQKGELIIVLEGKSGSKKFKSRLVVEIKGKSFDLVQTEKSVKVKDRYTRWRLASVVFKG